MRPISNNTNGQNAKPTPAISPAGALLVRRNTSKYVKKTDSASDSSKVTLYAQSGLWLSK